MKIIVRTVTLFLTLRDMYNKMLINPGKRRPPMLQKPNSE